MGDLSKAVFGRRRLPPRCILYGGAYVPSRKDVVRALFGKWSRLTGSWVKYAYAESQGKEYLVVFNVYGGPIALDVLQLLRDGGCKNVFFIGSMYAKDLPVGTLVIPVRIVDLTGLVAVDSDRTSVVELDSSLLSQLRKALDEQEIAYEEREIASVPAVLHGIDCVTEYVAKNKDVAGVEIEVSTFSHFSSKLGLRGYPLLHVSDNEKYGLISRARTVREARKRALRASTRVALEVLGGI